MEIYHEELSDVSRYIANHRDQTLDDNQIGYNAIMKILKRFVEPGSNTPMLEIGTGTGWFPLMCRLKGIPCDGLEISPQLVALAAKNAEKYGIDSPIRLGNIEDEAIQANSYEIVVCSSVFEHIENWRLALKKVHRALKPGGVFFFESTNKFSPISYEYGFPLYGWLPDKWRYAMRKKMQGPDIMKLGIDFNQFRYPMLRKAFRETGFTEIHDVIDLVEPINPVKMAIVKLARMSPIIKAPTLAFYRGTTFVCIKGDA